MTIRSHATPTTSTATEAIDGDVTDPAAPFELPVLDEMPDLAGALHALQAADQAQATTIDRLVRLHPTGLVETATGVGLDGWLTIIARRTRTDRRMLLCVVEICARLPHLHACFAAGELSWAQLRTLVLQTHQLPRTLDEQLDTALDAATEPGPPDLDHDGRPNHQTTATRRAHRLTDLCLAGPTADTSRVHLLLRTELSTLLDLDQTPGQLLTHLTGGAM